MAQGGVAVADLGHLVTEIEIRWTATEIRFLAAQAAFGAANASWMKQRGLRTALFKGDRLRPAVKKKRP